MSFYSEMAATALELLTEFGRPITYRAVTPTGGGAYNPGTGKAVSIGTAYSDSTRNAIVVDAPENRIGPQYGTNLKDGTLIQDADKWIYMDANGPDPRIQDLIIFDNVKYKIFNIQSVNPAGIPLIHLIGLKA
jgi:hypothetical protein